MTLNNLIFHSEYGQDRWLFENIFAACHGGVFVEAGALDGLLHSNTLFFERELGWRGVLIEAHPLVAAWLPCNRPLAKSHSCAIGDGVGIVQFCAVSGALFGWSSVVGIGDASAERRLSYVPPEQKHIYEVQRRPLSDVLRNSDVGQVDYLSLDVEGSEMQVLRNYPFDEIPIGIIGVEDNEGNNTELMQLLIEKGYKHLARVGVDEMWVHSTYTQAHLFR